MWIKKMVNEVRLWYEIAFGDGPTGDPWVDQIYGLEVKK